MPIVLKKRSLAIKPIIQPVTIFADDKIVDVPVSKVKLWADNPRRNDGAAPKLAELLKNRGQLTPIVVWRKTGVIYKGNTTYKALKLLGAKTVKVLYADFPSEAAAIAYGIADNKSSEFAEWDEDLLTNMLQSEEVSDTGFTDKEIRGLAMLPDLDMIDKINAADSGIKDKIIVMVLDAAKKSEVKDLLIQWVKMSQLKGIEIK